MSVQTLSHEDRAGAFLLSEAPGGLSRETVTVASGASLEPGAVLGRLTVRQAAAAIPSNAGTGTGAMTALTFGPDVQVGNYVITLTETSATADFTVVAPDGLALPDGAVGTAYTSSHLSFSIANGGTMTSGDTYTVAVTAAATPAVVGTGDGLMSAVSLGPKAELGTYEVINVLAGTNTGTWDVIAPSGATVGHGIITAGAGGTLVFTSDHVNFTITDGSTDFALGDYFNIIAANHSGQVEAWDPSAADGTQTVYGILYAAVDASSAAAAGVAIVRAAEVSAELLQYAATVTAGQKPTAHRELAAAHVIARS